MNSIRFICVSFLLAVSSICSGKEWHGIVPLKSTRADVERILGRSANAQQPIYYFPEETIILKYSKYGCSLSPGVDRWPTPPLESWNVPPDTVLTVSINLKKQVSLDTLSLDLAKFKKVRGDHDVSSHFYYVDDEAGFTIEVSDDGITQIVSGYIYGPRGEDEHLRCPNANSTPP